METTSVLPLTVVLFVVLIAASTDLWKFRIHNALTIPACLLGLLYHWSMEGPSGLVVSVLGILVANVPFIPLCLMGGMGAGDMKLMAVVGTWLGPWVMLHVIVVSGLATGCYSAGLIIRNRMRSAAGPSGTIASSSLSREREFCERAMDVTAVLSRSDRRSNAVPFGAMVALGVVVTIFWIG